MRKLLLTTFAIAFLASVTTAQAATFSSYTKPCPSGNAQLAYLGTPKLGGSFTVDGIRFPAFCTRRFCGCNVGRCNSCQGSALVIGISKTNIPLPGGCNLHASAEFILTSANLAGQITFNVPNNASLFGQKFYMQRMDLSLDEMITPSCGKAYVPTSFRGFSDAVEGTIGT